MIEINQEKISAVIITRNEGDNIRFCLQTLRWCDEIIIVDMESSDNTQKIAREFTGRIFTHKKILAFDKARRIGIENASGDWIFLLDADELVPRTLSETLKTVTGTKEYDAVFVPFKNYLFGEWNKHTGWWPDFHCRFFKKDIMDLSDKLHRYLILKPGAKKYYLPQKEEYAICHFAYRDVAQFLDKINRYSDIEADYFFNKKIRFGIIKLFILPLKTFFSRYIWHRGYKDGVHGLLVCLLLAMNQLVLWIKLWELHNDLGSKVFDRYIRLKTNIISDYSERENGTTL